MSQSLPRDMKMLLMQLYLKGYTADKATRMMNRYARHRDYPLVVTKGSLVRAMVPLAIGALESMDERAIEALKHIDEKAKVKVKLRIRDGYKVHWVEVEGLKPLVMLERLKEAQRKAKHGNPHGAGSELEAAIAERIRRGELEGQIELPVRGFPVRFAFKARRGRSRKAQNT